MMKKAFKCLVVFSLLLCFFQAGALANTVSFRYDASGHIAATCTKIGNKAICKGTVQPSKSTYTASIKVTLQKQNGGWKDVASWSASASAGQAVVKTGTATLQTGYSYRVVVSGTIKNSEGKIIEQPSKTSTTITY